MLERLIDKKIRILKAVIESELRSGTDKNDKPYSYKGLNTYVIQIPFESTMNVLNDLERQSLTMVTYYVAIPIFDEAGEPTDKMSDEYLIEVIIKDEQKLKNLLKKCETDYPKRQTPFIRDKALEMIAVKIGNMDSATKLITFLKNCGLDDELIVYPNTKWVMIKDALVYLSMSGRLQDRELLLKIISEAAHPLMHNGDKGTALHIQDEFSNYLQYDGLCFSKGKLVEATDELIEEMDERMKTREAATPDFGAVLDQMFGPTRYHRPATRMIDSDVIVPGSPQPLEVKIISMPTEFQIKENPVVKPKKTGLENKTIRYDDNMPAIFIGTQKVSIPPAKNEHYFARAMFSRQIGEFVDWSLIYPDMTGSEIEDAIKNQKAVRDTLNRLNERIQEIVGTDEELFSWQNKSLKRNY